MSTLTVAGNLAAAPELRFTPNGHAVARFTILENRRRKTEDGSGWEDGEPNAFNVQVWGAAAENVIASCDKGDRVVVSGTIMTDRWTDKETGAERTSQHLKADEVAFSLKFHTVRASKATRQSADSNAETEH